MNLNLAGLEFAIEVRVDFDGPRVADPHKFVLRHGRGGSADLLNERRRDSCSNPAGGAVQRQKLVVERGADLARDEGDDVAEGFVIIRVEIDAINRGNESLAPDAEGTLLHVAQDFSNEVIALETAWRAASHGFYCRRDSGEPAGGGGPGFDW